MYLRIYVRTYVCQALGKLPNLRAQFPSWRTQNPTNPLFGFWSSDVYFWFLQILAQVWILHLRYTDIPRRFGSADCSISIVFHAEVRCVDLWPNAVLEEEGFRSSDPEHFEMWHAEDPKGNLKKKTPQIVNNGEVESESLVNFGIDATKTSRWIAFETRQSGVSLWMYLKP